MGTSERRVHLERPSSGRSSFALPYRAVSVQEVYAVRVEGFADGFAAAERLASRTGAILRWAALWLDPAEPSLRRRHSELVAHFGSRLAVLAASEIETLVVCLVTHASSDVRHLVAHAANQAVVVHFSPAMYLGEEGPEAPWISFSDSAGHVRDDARVYRIELVCDAVPLTTSGDRPCDTGFSYGPQEASGWDLRLVVIRDHMPRAELVRWLSEAMGVPTASIRPIT